MNPSFLLGATDCNFRGYETSSEIQNRKPKKLYPRLPTQPTVVRSSYRADTTVKFDERHNQVHRRVISLIPNSNSELETISSFCYFTIEKSLTQS